MSRTPHQFDVLAPDGSTPWALAALPQPPPAGWRKVLDGLDGAAYETPRAEGLRAVLSGATESDGRRWLHLSLSHRQRLPTWDELRRTKEAFLGDRYALTVLPPPDRYVNLAPHVLHCFALADPRAQWVLPEFSGVVAGVRTL
ncbi:MAG TPA: hypothetical protein VG370_34830 [Chloroflexota bacterium]|nr:hypothetical protein [Chloroflexota bacterium]